MYNVMSSTNIDSLISSSSFLLRHFLGSSSSVLPLCIHMAEISDLSLLQVLLYKISLINFIFPVFSMNTYLLINRFIRWHLDTPLVFFSELSHSFQYG